MPPDDPQEPPEKPNAQRRPHSRRGPAWSTPRPARPEKAPAEEPSGEAAAPEAPETPVEEGKSTTASDAAERVKAFSVDLSEGLEKALKEIQERTKVLVKKGQHTKVRLKFRGKEIATVPMAVLLAAEAATFLGGGGLLRFLLVNALGRTLLEVELINEADSVVTAGKQRLLDGDLDEALARFREAIAMDAAHPAAHLNLGIALKLQGKRDEAIAAFEKVVELDPDGDTGREARRQLENLRPRPS